MMNVFVIHCQLKCESDGVKWRKFVCSTHHRKTTGTINNNGSVWYAYALRIHHILYRSLEILWFKVKTNESFLSILTNKWHFFNKKIIKCLDGFLDVWMRCAKIWFVNNKKNSERRKIRSKKNNIKIQFNLSERVILVLIKNLLYNNPLSSFVIQLACNRIGTFRGTIRYIWLAASKHSKMELFFDDKIDLLKIEGLRCVKYQINWIEYVYLLNIK